MFQITDGTFAMARQYCIRDHTVATAGPWHDLSSCWFNSLYARILPSHAAEMTAAYLHQSVVDILAARRAAKVSLGAKAKTGCGDSSVRVEERRVLRRARLSRSAGRALRDP